MYLFIIIIITIIIIFTIIIIIIIIIIPKSVYFENRINCCLYTKVVLVALPLEKNSRCLSNTKTVLLPNHFRSNHESMFLWVVPKRYFFKSSCSLLLWYIVRIPEIVLSFKNQSLLQWYQNGITLKTVFYFAFIPQCYYHNRITFKKKTVVVAVMPNRHYFQTRVSETTMNQCFCE